MVDKCANPKCSATFRRLCDGKLFVTEVETDYHNSVSGHQRLREYSWLCNSCCRTMIVIVEKGKRAQVVPLLKSATGVRAAL